MKNIVARIVLILSAAFLAQCTDKQPLAPIGDGPAVTPRAASFVMTCRASVSSGTVNCTSDEAGSFLTAGSPLSVAHNAFGSGSVVLPPAIIVGGQNTFVKLTSSNVTSSAGIFGFDVTVQNLIPQAMGTNDGTTPTAEGVRVFFVQQPTILGGASGTIGINNADGTENFTTAGQPYYQYDGILDPNEVSGSKHWEFNFTGTFNFEFKVMVWAPVRYPDGWVIVTPPSDQLEMPSDPDVQLSGSVVDAVGRAVTSPPAIVWGSSNNSVATVDGTGLVTAVGAGSATITATAGTYTGEAAITVIGAVDHFLVEAEAGGSIGTQASGVAFNVKITAQDALNQTVTDFTGTVDLTSTPAGLGVTSGAFTAGVLASQSVTIASGGNYTITATRSGGSEAGTSNNFDVTAVSGAVADDVSGTSAPNDPYHTPLNTALSIPDGAQDLLANDNRGFPLANVSHFGAVQCNDGSGTLNAATDAVTANTAGSTIANLNGIGGCTGGSLTVNADGTLTFTPTATYTGLFRFQYRITNSAGFSDAQVTLAVGARPTATNSTYTPVLVGNVPINTATSTNTLVTASGDQLVFNVTGNSNGTGAVASGKTYSFTPALGYSGPASFTFTATNGFGASSPATVSLTVGARVWFVQAGAGAGGDGRPATPFNCLVGTNCFDDSVNEANDIVYVASGSYASAGALVLKDGQRVIGAAASAAFATTSGLTWPADAGSAPASGGAAVNLSTSTGNVITLGNGNTLRGLALGNAQAASVSLSGTNFGTLTVANDVSISTNTQALSLTNGTISGDFGGVTSSGGASNIALTTVGGTTNLGGGALSGATGNAVVVNGGTAAVTYTGNITQASNAALLSVSGGHNGTLAFGTGLLSASNGTGLQFDNADGTYTFTGTTTLNGGDAGIDILNGSGGTFGFGAGTSITHTGAGQAFFHSGSTANVTYSGNITRTSGAGWIVDVFNQSGTITFDTGTLSDNAGGGILMNNADGTISFNGTTTLSGPARYRIGGGSSGAISFGAGASHSNPVTNSALEIVAANGATNVTFAGTLTSTSNTHTKLADIQGVSSGSVTVSGALSATGGAQGISVSNNSGGTITFSNATKTLTTNTNAAVTLTTNPGATIQFTGNNLALTTTTARAMDAIGGGTLIITGTGNTILTSGAAANALRIDGLASGAGGINFASVNAGGATTTAAITLNNVSGANTVALGTVTITGGATGLSLTNNAAPITATPTVNAVSGVGVQLTSNAGAVTLNAGAIGNTDDPGGNAVDISGGNADITIAGPITKNTGAGRIVNVASHSGGTVSLQGALSCTSACTGINASSNSGGTIEFSNGTKTISTGASQAITLSSNTGATINFSNGGLVVTTTSATVFGASGGGTVNVSGSNNTLTTETDGSPVGGTILSADGVSGALTFKKLAGHGGATTANGILLNNTTGLTLTVTGDGSANSGGTIQAYKERGARFVTANNISLTRMLFTGNGTANLATAGTCGDGANGTNTNCAAGIDMQTVNTVSMTNVQVTGSVQIGINGKNVTNLTLNTIEVNGNGNEALEDGIQIHNLFGTMTWTDLNIHDNASRQLEVQNSSGTYTLTINKGAGTLFFGNSAWPGAATSAQGILAAGSGGSNTSMTVNNATFARNFSAAFQADISGSASITVDVNGGSSIDNGQHWSVGAAGTGNLTNTLRNMTSMYQVVGHTAVTGIALLKSLTHSGSMTTTIENNSIGDAAIASSGSVCNGCNVISVRNEQTTGTHNVRIQGNTIRRSQGGGISIFTGNSGDNAAMNVKIWGNLLTDPDGTSTNPILVTNGGGTTPNTSTTCADIGSSTDVSKKNTVNDPAGGGTWLTSDMIRTRNVNASQYKLVGYAGGATDVAAVVAYMNARNTFSTGTASASVGGSGGTYGNSAGCF